MIISIPNNNSAALWAMSPEDFNEWRANNDIPILFDYFVGKLPQFKTWLNLFKIDKQIFCLGSSTGHFFWGETKKILVPEFNGKGQVYYHLSEQTKERFEEYHRRNGLITPPYLEFEPYFNWAKKNLGRERFFFSDKVNNQITDTFIYNRWGGGRAELLQDVEVLKLGGRNLSGMVAIGKRNLDFVDLDDLTISGEWHGSYATEINYSSCRNLKIENAKIFAYSFRYCTIQNLNCAKSDIQNFLFLDSLDIMLTPPQFSDCRLRNFKFIRCRALPEFDKCEINELIYEPNNKNGYVRIADEYRRLRNTFQQVGKRHEASQYYYLERQYERKALLNPYIENREKFPPMRFAGSISGIYEYWYKKAFSKAKSLKNVWLLLLFHVRVWIDPRYSYKALWFKVRYVVSLFEELLWGYGERPARIFFNALLIIAGFGAYYYLNFSHLKLPDGDMPKLGSSLYFSIVTFTTLGYGDVLPNTSDMRLICASEALCGAFLMGLVVAGFSNKSRY